MFTFSCFLFLDNLGLPYGKTTDMQLRFLKVNKYAQIPEAGEDRAFDLKMVGKIGNTYYEGSPCFVYDSGLKVEIPRAYMGILVPHESINTVNLVMPSPFKILPSGWQNLSVEVKRLRGENTENSLPIYRLKEAGFPYIAKLIILPALYFEAVEVESKLKN